MKTIKLADGRVVSGEFVRNYGKKVQVRAADGKKYTGEPIAALALKVEPLVRGSKQKVALEFLRAQPKSSYKQIAAALAIPVPRAARVIASLVKNKQIEKQVSEEGNTYRVL